MGIESTDVDKGNKWRISNSKQEMNKGSVG